MELWVACDVSASGKCPLLTDYDPGIYCDLLQNLILPFKSQLERLNKVEEYILLRRQRSALSSQLVFGEFGSRFSFAVRYYQQSPQHQDLLDQIERQARSRRQKKCEEFRRLKEQYGSLMSQQERLTCETITIFDEYWGRTELVMTATVKSVA